jgi:phage anti-repressor protein
VKEEEESRHKENEISATNKKNTAGVWKKGVSQKVRDYFITVRRFMNDLSTLMIKSASN